MLEIPINWFAVVHLGTKVDVGSEAEVKDMEGRVAVGDQIRSCYQDEQFATQLLFIFMSEELREKIVKKKKVKDRFWKFSKRCR